MITELIEKQERHCKLELTSEEREAVAAFFLEREREQGLMDVEGNSGKNGITAVGSHTLRNDTSAPDADRRAFMDMAPDTDGAFVRVLRTL